MGVPNCGLRKKVKAWRKKYRASRYLEYLPLNALQERHRWILRNAFSLNELRRMSGSGLREEELATWEQLVEVSEEFRVRNEWPRQRGDSVRVLKTAGAPPEFLKAAESAIRSIDYPDGPFLIRYAKRKYLEQALDTGKVRISPASKFSDDALPAGVRDNELVKEVQAFPIEVRARHAFSGRTKTLSVPGSFSIPMDRDYFLLSLSRALLPTLFWEICPEEPACLIIRDGPWMQEALFKASTDVLGGWKFEPGLVQYVDPNPPCESPSGNDSKNPYMQKHFRYFYQGEFRVAWIPPRPVRELPHVELSVANLGEYAELLTFTV